MQKSVMVLVAGGSGSGKTRFVRTIASHFPTEIVTSLRLDDYYYDLSHLDAFARGKRNFDHPDALDMNLFCRHLANLKDGVSIEKPVYAFDTHTRSGTAVVRPTPLIFIDGIFALYEATARQFAHLSIFIDIPHEVRLQRRLTRDIAERGRTEAEVKEQYEATVRPMYDLFVEPTKKHADIVIGLSEQMSESYEPLIETIKGFLAESTT